LHNGTAGDLVIDHPRENIHRVTANIPALGGGPLEWIINRRVAIGVANGATAPKSPASPHAATDGGLDRRPAGGERRGERGQWGA
jgi:hypothetical protein